MPLHDSKRVEYSIDSGHIEIVTNQGQKVPAYWAHPRVGSKFSGICLLHDWWGSTRVMRLVANFFAQMGYYVVAPDMYLGQTATNVTHAMELYQRSKKTRFKTVDAALTVLETHHRINRSVAALGMGMGGTMAFEAAIQRDDLEAAVAFAGFPQDYFGEFHKANTPILAVYGEHEPYIKADVIDHLQAEFAATPLAAKHRVVTINGAGHNFFAETPDPKFQHISKAVINQTLDFLEQYLIQPKHMPQKRF